VRDGVAAHGTVASSHLFSTQIAYLSALKGPIGPGRGWYSYKTYDVIAFVRSLAHLAVLLRTSHLNQNALRLKAQDLRRPRLRLRQHSPLNLRTLRHIANTHRHSTNAETEPYRQ